MGSNTTKKFDYFHNWHLYKYKRFADVFNIYEVKYRHLEGCSPNAVCFFGSKFYDTLILKPNVGRRNIFLNALLLNNNKMKSKVQHMRQPIINVTFHKIF